MKKFAVNFAILLAIIFCVSLPVTVAAQINSTDKSTDKTINTQYPTSAVEPATEAKVIPSAVTGLKASSVQSDSLVLNWDKSDNADLYTIYRSTESAGGKFGEYKKYKTVKNTTFRDKDLSPAKIYKYRIFAYNITDEYITQSASAVTSVMTKLENVASVTLSDKKTSSMRLSWSKNLSADKYIIYRSDEKDDGSFSKYKRLREVESGSPLSFTDKKLSGGTVYKYKVFAKRIQSGNSAVSAGKSVKGMTKFSAPAKFKKLKAAETAIKLGWSEVLHADKYELFRDGIKIKTLKSTTYTDKGLASGSLHYYNVRAVRKVANNVRTGNFATLNASCKIPGTRIEVSISKQTLKLYVKNKVVLKTPVITGAPGDRATELGHHHIISRKSPAILKGSYRGSKWTTRVNYWLGFTYSGQGIHDATWQSAFGGQYYRQGRGSHGCVNTPMAAVKKIYEKAYVGMLIIIKN